MVDVALSGDLGYTYGVVLVAASVDSEAAISNSYVRIWKKESDSWRVIIDLLSPVPPAN